MLITSTLSLSGAFAPAPDEAQLLRWELRVPTGAGVEAALDSLAAAGAVVERDDGAGAARDPWGTTLRLLPVEAGDASSSP